MSEPLGRVNTTLLKSQGYLRVPKMYSEQFCRELDDEATLMERHYTPENVDRHAAYISDRSPSRVSYAMMISRSMRSDLPVVKHVVHSEGGEQPLSAIHHFLCDHDEIVEELTGRRVSPESRSMLNWQRYSEGSKPVAEHFDGDYLKYTKRSPTEFDLEEGVLPRYVFVLTVANENTEGVTGTVLRDLKTGEVFTPASEPGDLLIFDNIRFRHSVPSLSKPRRMLGLRNFDHMGLHFAKTPELKVPGYPYSEMPEGLVSGSCAVLGRSFDSVGYQKAFIEGGRWARVREQQKAEGALF